MDIQILTYDQVDPLEVLHLNLVALEYALTPQRLALVRRLDPRPFPFFALYAVLDGALAGQVSVYRLPVVTVDGPEDVGGISAVCTHPAYARQGIAARLIEEAHQHMRRARMRFSTLGTSAYRGAYHLYRHLGYEDVLRAGLASAPREVAVSSGDLTARPAELGEISLADGLYQRLAPGKIAFTRRPDGFLGSMTEIGEIDPHSLWLIFTGGILCGFARVSLAQTVLRVYDMFLAGGVSPVQAVAALAFSAQADYISLELFHPWILRSLGETGYHLSPAGWGVFMAKSLILGLPASDLGELLDIGSDRFIMWSVDIT